MNKKEEKFTKILLVFGFIQIVVAVIQLVPSVDKNNPFLGIAALIFAIGFIIYMFKELDKRI